MRNPKKRIGVLGGTFNPIHNGHLSLIKAAHEQYDLPLVLVMPTFSTYYKGESELLAPQIRLEMVEAACSEISYAKASDLDIRRGVTTLTADTIDDLKALGYEEIFFIIGGDSLLYIDKWVRADYFLKECTFLYSGRLSSGTDSVMEKKAEYLKNTFAADVRPLHMTDVPYSSTEIRKKIRNGESVTEEIPAAVESFIRENKLYQDV